MNKELSMNRNMKQWLSDMLAADRKTALPILSFPSVSLLGDRKSVV